jgi:hypothetical protein
MTTVLRVVPGEDEGPRGGQAQEKEGGPHSPRIKQC